jgi:hypothetical protein
VLSGLRTHLAAEDDFNGTTAPEERTEVRYGWETGWQATEKVYLGRSRAATPPAALRTGRNVRQESGTFELIVYVIKPGASPEDAEARAFAIAAECEDWLSTRKSNELGVTGLQSLIVSEWASDLGPADSGNGAIVTLTLSWSARLDA